MEETLAGPKVLLLFQFEPDLCAHRFLWRLSLQHVEGDVKTWVHTPLDPASQIEFSVMAVDGKSPHLSRWDRGERKTLTRQTSGTTNKDTSTQFTLQSCRENVETV